MIKIVAEREHPKKNAPEPKGWVINLRTRNDAKALHEIVRFLLENYEEVPV